MLNKLIISLISLASSLIVLFGILPSSVNALDCANPTSSKEELQCGACGGSGINSTDCPNAANNSSKTLNGTIKNVINLFSILGGIVAVVMIVAAGFRYITSSGAQEPIAAAKRTLMYALIGLVIIALAQLIAKYALHTVTTTTTTQSSSGASGGGISPTPSGAKVH